MKIIKNNKIDWVNKLIKFLKIIYFLITFDLSDIDNDLFNNLNPGEKIIIGIIAFICTGIFIWTVTHDEDFEKKLKEMDNDKWKKPR